MLGSDLFNAFIDRLGTYISYLHPPRKLSPDLLIIAVLTLPCWFSLSCVNIQVPVTETYSETSYVTDNITEKYNESILVNTQTSGQYALTPYIMWSNADLDFQGGFRNIWYYGYNFSEFARHDMEKMRITILEQKYYENSVFRVFDMTQRGQILAPPLIAAADTAPSQQVGWSWISTRGSIEAIYDWLNLANIKLNYAKFLGGRQNIWSKNQDSYNLEFDLKDAREIAVIISGPINAQNVKFTASIAWADNHTEYRTVTAEHQVPFQQELRVEKQRTVLQTRQVPFWDILFNK
ncbi:MAG: hypothetical protein PHO26_04580 [Dehalococcoidia bacterium]|nr:hypothetical protein [Dehalococcoidia bacterium]MDD5494640.1 hypothetical protein [Dehalococcoidia bacterium]